MGNLSVAACEPMIYQSLNAHSAGVSWVHAVDVASKVPRIDRRKYPYIGRELPAS